MNKLTWTKLLCHLLIVLAGMFLTFFVIDRVNPAMEFLDNDISDWLLCAFTVLTIVQSAIGLIVIRKVERWGSRDADERE